MPYLLLIALLIMSGHAATEPLNPRLKNLPANTWVKFNSSKNKSLQNHAGAVYDSKRGTIIIFGSDTHQSNWDNSVREFNPFTGKWRQHYKPAAQSTYRLDDKNRPIAGPPDTPQPWAMHTFDAMVYDPKRDTLVVSSTPGHQQKTLKQFKKPKADLKVTWLYDLSTQRWSMLENAGKPAPTSFAGALAYDEKRDTIFLSSKRRFAELGPNRDQWRGGSDQKVGEIHFMLEYDSKHHKILAFGDYKGSDKIWAYTPAAKPGKIGKWQQRKPSGDALPPDEHYPVAYDSDQGLFLLVPDQGGRTATLVYDYGKNRLTRLKGAKLPTKLGMHYKMVYDRFHKVFLLITGNWKDPATVWALRLDPAKFPAPKKKKAAPAADAHG